MIPVGTNIFLYGTHIPKKAAEVGSSDDDKGRKIAMEVYGAVPVTMMFFGVHFRGMVILSCVYKQSTCNYQPRMTLIAPEDVFRPYILHQT